MDSSYPQCNVNKIVYNLTIFVEKCPDCVKYGISKLLKTRNGNANKC